MNPSTSEQLAVVGHARVLLGASGLEFKCPRSCMHACCYGGTGTRLAGVFPVVRKDMVTPEGLPLLRPSFPNIWAAGWCRWPWIMAAAAQST